VFQPYPETADNVQIVKANPGYKWVRSLVEKKCQRVAVGLQGAHQNTNAAPVLRRGASSRTVLAQGLPSHLGHCQEGGKAEGAAVVRTSSLSWGLGPICPPSLGLAARGTTAGRDCQEVLVSHCETSWSFQLSEIAVPWAVSHRKMLKWMFVQDYRFRKKKIHNWDPLLKEKKKTSHIPGTDSALLKEKNL